MSREIRTEIRIGATAERVWDVLADFDSYAHWNPFVRRVDGVPVEGMRLTVWLQMAGRMPVRFRPVLRRASHARELRWEGHLLVPGLFDGTHVFELHETGRDSVEFVHREEFTGVLAPVLFRRLGEPTREAFHAMNRALKARCENGAP